MVADPTAFRLLGPLLGAGVDIATQRYAARHARE
jgi:hypothetical protein